MIAASIVKAVGIEIPKDNLHLANWHCRNIDSEAAWACVWETQAFLDGEGQALIPYPAAFSW